MAKDAAEKSIRATRPRSEGDLTEHDEVMDLPECFVMMPISDPDGYAQGHFQRVYEDIIRPACRMAGYRATRADYVQETNLIHLDMLQRLLNAPVAVCDLSTRNANVLFELGLRQAFDKPVVLIRETGTPDLFDVAPLRATPYRPTRIYNEVIEDHARIRDAILATVRAAEKNEGVNSLVRLLSLSRPAALPEVSQQELDPVLQVVRAEITALRSEMRQLVNRGHESMAEPVFEYNENWSAWDEDMERAIRRENPSLRVVDDLEAAIDAAALILYCSREAAAELRERMLDELFGESSQRKVAGIGSKNEKAGWIICFWFEKPIASVRFRTQLLKFLVPGTFVHRVLTFAEAESMDSVPSSTSRP